MQWLALLYLGKLPTLLRTILELSVPVHFTAELY